MVLNLISGEGLKNEQAVLTDERLYYNHREGLINRISTREIVDAADITGTKITDNKPYSILIVAILILIGSIIGASSADDGSILALSLIHISEPTRPY